MSKNLRKGRFTTIEQSVIKKNIAKLGPEEVARKLNRDTASIVKWAMLKGIPFGDNIPEPSVAELAIEQNIKESPQWRLLKDEFDLEERKYFGEMYAKLAYQFKDDLLATEEAQVFQLIKFDILVHRAMAEIKIVKIDAVNLEKVLMDTYNTIERMRNDGENIPDHLSDTVQKLESQLSNLRAATQQKTKEIIELQGKVSSITKELKGTRDQRIDKVENSKRTWSGLLKDLEDEGARVEEGRRAELMKIAMQKETEKLSEYHTYVDGSVDKPLLNADTVE